MKNVLWILSFTLVWTGARAEDHGQKPQIRVRPPAELRVETIGDRTFRVFADGTRVEVRGSIQSGPNQGANLRVEANPEQCDVRFEGTANRNTVTGRVSIEPRTIPISVNASNLHGRTDTVRKTILGGEIGVYGLVKEIDFTGTLKLTKGEGTLRGDIRRGVTATIVVEGNGYGSAVARGTTESWVKNSRRSVGQVGYFNVNPIQFRDTFAIQVNCVNSKLQVTLPLSHPDVNVRAKVNLARTSLRPMFEIGKRFPNASASIRSSLLVRYEPTINQKLNAKIKSLVSSKSQDYFEFKRNLAQKILSSPWLNEARKVCACSDDVLTPALEKLEKN